MPSALLDMSIQSCCPRFMRKEGNNFGLVPKSANIQRPSTITSFEPTFISDPKPMKKRRMEGMGTQVKAEAKAEPKHWPCPTPLQIPTPKATSPSMRQATVDPEDQEVFWITRSLQLPDERRN